jgi:ankyrin repeat protein
MTVLPAQPNLDHLRRQARDLLRAARTGNTAAAERIHAVSDQLNLTAAQLAVAREYGFASWAKLKTEVQARSAELAQLADEFCRASIRDWTGRAARMLAARPELASYNLATAVVLGDVDRVRAALGADPGLVTRTDPATGWTALHAACASQWSRLDPGREDGLVAVGRLLLDAGADPNGVVPGGGWKPLKCAVAGAPNAEIARLLVDRGAVPDDDDLYLAGFADDHESLRLLLSGTADLSEIARMALAAPISGNDVEGVRMLLEAGADPRRYLDDSDAEGGSETAHPFSVLYAAVRSDCSAEIVELLLAHGAEPERPGTDGRSPHALAVRKGRDDLAELLRRYGASDDASAVDRFLAACLRADREAAERQLPSDLSAQQRSAAMIRAAETGNTEAMRVMLDLGFPVDARAAETTRERRCTRPRTREARTSPGCCSSEAPTSRRATTGGTARPWSGRSSAAASGRPATPLPTGPPLSRFWPTPVRPSTASRFRMTTIRRALPSSNCCAAMVSKVSSADAGPDCDLVIVAAPW